MLSPAVRAAADKWAAEFLFESIAQNAGKAGYLAGYAAGYVARKPERFPLAGDQAFKRLLGAYLAENITVYHPNTGRYGLLRGLPACYEGQGEPLADVEFYADAEAREEGGGDLLEPYGKLLPVLYSFEDLATEMPLPDGRRVVPAVEVANRYLTANGYKQEATGTLGTEKVITAVTPSGRVAGGVYRKDFESGLLIEIDILRQWHFAVGLAPHQYHRRQPGFDYASGGKPGSSCYCDAFLNEAAPGCAGCARKEVCRA